MLCSRTSIKRPPSIKRPFSKVPNYLSLNICIWYLYSTTTSIYILRGRGHIFAATRLLFTAFFTSIKRPTNCLYKQNGDRKTIICIKNLAEAINMAHQPWHLPCFAVTRTLFYLSDGQMACSALVTIPRPITANNSKCGNKGHLMYVTMIFACLHICTLFNEYFAP